jgi:hypothetical protein
MTRAKRETEIQSSAESQGWTAANSRGRFRHQGNISKVGTRFGVLARPYSKELLHRYHWFRRQFEELLKRVVRFFWRTIIRSADKHAGERPQKLAVAIIILLGQRNQRRILCTGKRSPLMFCSAEKPFARRKLIPSFGFSCPLALS